jgi:hypothetical protein
MWLHLKTTINIARIFRINIFRMLKINQSLATIQGSCILENNLHVNKNSEFCDFLSGSVPMPIYYDRSTIACKTSNPQSWWKPRIWQSLWAQNCPQCPSLRNLSLFPCLVIHWKILIANLSLTSVGVGPVLRYACQKHLEEST